MVGAVELAPPAHQPGRRSRVRVGAIRLLQVVDVLDLRVRADALVIATEVRLAIRQEDGLVLGASERRDGEVPPLREEEGQEERRESDTAVAQQPRIETPTQLEMTSNAADHRLTEIMVDDLRRPSLAQPAGERRLANDITAAAA